MEPLHLLEGLVGVREAREEDLAGVYEVEVRCFGSQAYPLRLLKALLILHGEFFLVAVDGDRVVGYVVAAPMKGYGHILSIAVDPSMQRRGVGSALLSEVMGRLRARGINRFRLEVRADNEAAIRFYERHGFKLIGVA
ncbi:ribosomal-protein-alanine N-acetyltransferase, partial [Candidatus Geothermarchaeota archaeon ex4572_27]